MRLDVRRGVFDERRIVLQAQGPATAGARPCETCGRTTSEGKPWCSDHVDRAPYVRELLARIESRDRRTGRPDPTLVEDARHALELLGRVSLERLAREVATTRERVQAVARELVRSGSARLTRTRRGKPALRAVG